MHGCIMKKCVSKDVGDIAGEFGDLFSDRRLVNVFMLSIVSDWQKFIYEENGLLIWIWH